jgi:predicted deacylase
MIQANIHAGEVEGKEALLALLPHLTLAKSGRKILSKLRLVAIPEGQFEMFPCPVERPEVRFVRHDSRLYSRKNHGVNTSVKDESTC